MLYTQYFDWKEKADEYAKSNSSLDYFQVPISCSAEVIHINFRPHLKKFLEKIAMTFETHIFTAGDATYAKKIAQLLDPKGIYFKKIWSQEHCEKKWNEYYKDLSKLPLGRDDLKRVVLLDDHVANLVASMGNDMLIKPFEDDPNDKELKKVQRFLLNKLKDCGKNVQPILEAKAKKEHELEIMFYHIMK